MKCLVAVLLILLFTAPALFAGNQWESKYDASWEISVTDCKGTTTIYKGCHIVNDNLFVVTFMPDQGRIPTESGSVIRIYRSNCTEVTMIAE